MKPRRDAIHDGATHAGSMDASWDASWAPGQRRAAADNIITETGDNIITEGGDQIITE